MKEREEIERYVSGLFMQRLVVALVLLLALAVKSAFAQQPTHVSVHTPRKVEILKHEAAHNELKFGNPSRIRRLALMKALGAYDKFDCRIGGSCRD